MGPHPAVAEIRRAVRLSWPLCSVATGASPGSEANTVLIGCSGGADSLALAAAVAFEAPRAGWSAGLITIDHGLQDGSAERALRVAEIGYELGLNPVEVIRVEVGLVGGPEAAARTARYGALDASANALGAALLLGHTLDDQAETVLLGLGRGSGPRSIAGMAGLDGHRVRPFLGVRRGTTAAACAALGLPAWDDPHNVDPAFQRVRLRTEALPLLEEILQGGVADALARTAELIRDDLDALDQLAAACTRREPGQGDSGDLDGASLAGQPRAIRTRVLKHWAESRGAGSLTSTHIAELDRLLVDWRGQGPIQLPGAVVVQRTSGTLSLHPIPELRIREK
jgi:tRNA(Ile)-lysidine synthase